MVKADTLSLDAFNSRDGGKIGMVSKTSVTWFAHPRRRPHLEVDHVKQNVQLVANTQGANDLLLRACIAAYTTPTSRQSNPVHVRIPGRPLLVAY